MSVRVEDCSEYATIRSDIAHAKGEPLLLMLPTHERWYMPDPLYPSPAELLLGLLSDHLRCVSLAAEMPDVAATLLAHGTACYDGMYFRVVDDDFIDCSLSSARSWRLAEDLALASFCSSLLAGMLVLRAGVLHAFLPTTDPAMFRLLLDHNEQPRTWLGMDYDPMTVTRSDDVDMLFSDMVSGILGERVVPRSKFFRKVVLPLWNHQNASASATHIADVNIRTSMQARL